MSDSGFTAEILETRLDRCEYIHIYMFTWIHGYIHIHVDIYMFM